MRVRIYHFRAYYKKVCYGYKKTSVYYYNFGVQEHF